MQPIFRPSDRQHYLENVKRAFIECRGDLRSFSREATRLPFAPTYAELVEIATEEGWLEARVEYMENVRSRQMVDKAETMARQLRIAKKSQEIAEQALNRLDPEKLTVKEAVMLLKWGAHLEQLLMGMANNPVVNVSIDFSKMPDRELDAIIAVNKGLLSPSLDSLVEKAGEQVAETLNLKPNPYGSYSLD